MLDAAGSLAAGAAGASGGGAALVAAGAGVSFLVPSLTVRVGTLGVAGGGTAAGASGAGGGAAMVPPGRRLSLGILSVAGAAGASGAGAATVPPTFRWSGAEVAGPGCGAVGFLTILSLTVSFLLGVGAMAESAPVSPAETFFRRPVLVRMASGSLISDCGTVAPADRLPTEGLGGVPGAFSFLKRLVSVFGRRNFRFSGPLSLMV